MSTAAGALPAFLRSFDLPEPGELRRVARVYVWGRWFVWSIAAFAWLYPFNVDEVVYGPNVALAILLFATNGYLHYRLATERTVSWRWMLALSALDLAMLSGGVAAHRGFESPFLVGYYPSLAMFAVVFGSVRLTLVWVTMTAAVYAALCLAVEPGVDFSLDDEEVLLVRVAGMYLVVVVVNLISRVERIRRTEAVERERALHRERVELSRAIHDTTAQSAYLIGLGIDAVKQLVGDSNEEVRTRLEATSKLSKTAIWELRHPIDVGRIFDGRELGRDPGVPCLDLHAGHLGAGGPGAEWGGAAPLGGGQEPAVLDSPQRPHQRFSPRGGEQGAGRARLRGGRSQAVGVGRRHRSSRGLRRTGPRFRQHAGGRRAAGRESGRRTARAGRGSEGDLRGAVGPQ